MRNLVALPLRMFAGALGIFEELFRTAADAVSEGDPTGRGFGEARGLTRGAGADIAAEQRRPKT